MSGLFHSYIVSLRFSVEGIKTCGLRAGARERLALRLNLMDEYGCVWIMSILTGMFYQVGL